MGVQPPSENAEDGPTVVEFGIAALDAKLKDRDLAFPLDREELVTTHGDITVPIDASGHEMRLEAALECCDRREFESERDLLNTLHPIFEDKREATSRSVVAQLRALVPF